MFDFMGSDWLDNATGAFDEFTTPVTEWSIPDITGEQAASVAFPDVSPDVSQWFGPYEPMQQFSADLLPGMESSAPPAGFEFPSFVEPTPLQWPAPDASQGGISPATMGAFGTTPTIPGAGPSAAQTPGAAGTAGVGAAPPAGTPSTLPGGPVGGGGEGAGAAPGKVPTGAPEDEGVVSKVLNKLGIWGPKGIGPNAIPAIAMLGNLYKQNKVPNIYSSMGGTGATALKQLGEKPTQIGNQLMDQYIQGKVMPAQAYEISQWALQAKARVQDQFARMGMGSSSQLQLALNDIDAKAAAMMDQARQNVLKAGLDAANVGIGPTRDAIIAQAQQDYKLSEAQSKFLEALGKGQTVAGTVTSQAQA